MRPSPPRAAPPVRLAHRPRGHVLPPARAARFRQPHRLRQRCIPPSTPGPRPARAKADSPLRESSARGGEKGGVEPFTVVKVFTIINRIKGYQ